MTERRIAIAFGGVRFEEANTNHLLEDEPRTQIPETSSPTAKL